MLMVRLALQLFEHDRLTFFFVSVELTRDLVLQMYLVGGGALTAGSVERLFKEISFKLPHTLKPRFLSPSKNERHFSAFTGGSILASLGSFQQMWVSKAEYAESGARFVVERCFY